MLFTLLFNFISKPLSLRVILHSLSYHASNYFLSLLLLTLVFVRPVQAEVWLSENLHIDNQQYLQLSSVNNSSKNNSAGKDSTTSLRLLPEFSLIQNIPAPSVASKITLGSKLDLQGEKTQTNNGYRAQSKSQAIINELHLTTALGPYWSFILGRQKIAYAQQDLFSTSLNKNDIRPAPLDKLTFSQGLLTTLRIGIIEQSLLLNQETENKESKLSTHYQIKLGIPGYKVGPLVLLLSQEDKFQESYRSNQTVSRVMLGSALQFPLGFITGHWQWAFQFASEIDNEIADNQQAWQTSVSWLGFIPNHKVGILFAHTDTQWAYSDDFILGTNHSELRYQWRMNQRLTLELAASTIYFNAVKKDTENEIALSIHLKF
jgi:hypothetical protein